MRLVLIGALLAGLTGPAVAQDATMGAQLFSRCTICHEVGEGARNRVGPVLNGVVGRQAGTYTGFPYSQALREAGENGLVWTPEALAGYLAGPRDFMHGVAMAFRGFRSDADIADVIAYLETQSP